MASGTVHEISFYLVELSFISQLAFISPGGVKIIERIATRGQFALKQPFQDRDVLTENTRSSK